MVKKVTWTKVAEIQLEEIFTYWIDRTKSYSYSIKISTLIYERLNWIAKVKFKDKKTTTENIFITFIRDFGIFYEYTDSELFVYTVWDIRSNPDFSPFDF
jgi:hypothetical protein